MYNIKYFHTIKNQKNIRTRKKKKIKQILNSEISFYEVDPIIDVKNESFFCYVLTL